MAGNDVTARFAPRLKSMSIDRSAGKAADNATILLANPNGSVFLPPARAPIQVLLSGQWAFEGFVTEVEATFSKSNGREIEITASSVDHGAKVKEPALWHKDNDTFGGVAQFFGSKANLAVTVLGSIASIERDYWIQQNESFHSWGQRISRELGATFKVIGSRAFFAARNEGLSASGRPLTPIVGTVGQNLISARLRPVVSRPRFTDVKISYFDKAKGEKVEEEISTGVSGVDAALRTLYSAATKEHAKQHADSRSKESNREKGQGDVVLLGDARAEPEATFTAVGVAPGADGQYIIDTLSHRVDKSGGFKTNLTLRLPGEGVGSDPR